MFACACDPGLDSPNAIRAVGNKFGKREGQSHQPAESGQIRTQLVKKRLLHTQRL